MQALLSDPQTLPFIHNQQINLHCLKQEINRRMEKIRALLMEPHSLQELAHYGCQTDSLEQEEETNTGRFHHRRVLSTYNSNIIAREDQLPSQERPSLPYRKKRCLTIENCGDGDENLNPRTRVSDYLSSKKDKEIIFSNLLIREPSCSSGGKEAGLVRESQDDKIFTSIEFELHNSCQTVGSFLEKSPSPQFTLPVTQQVSSEDLSPFRGSDLDQEGRKSFSTIARRQHSIRKIRFTERTNLTENEARIIVGDECRLKVLNLLEKVVAKKRKEPTDNKLRVNIIKKIEEKYGDYYGNI